MKQTTTTKKLIAVRHLLSFAPYEKKKKKSKDNLTAISKKTKWEKT